MANDIIRFPGNEGGKKSEDTSEKRSTPTSSENISTLRRWYEEQDRRGVKFQIDWRKLLLAQEMLPKLRQASQQRELRVVKSVNPEKIHNQELVELFNNSNQTKWQKNPSFWVAVYEQIRKRGLSIAEIT